MFSLMLQSSFHHDLEHLVILTFLENLYQVEFTISMYS